MEVERRWSIGGPDVRSSGSAKRGANSLAFFPCEVFASLNLKCQGADSILHGSSLV